MRNLIKLNPLGLGAALAACALVTVSGPTAMAAQKSAPATIQNLLRRDKVPSYAAPYHGSLPKTGATGSAFPATGGGSSVTRIVGGSPAQISNYPYVVGVQSYFLGVDPSTGNIVTYLATCTGTVVSSTQVVTAGHCDTDLPFATTYVIAGRNVLSDTTSGYVDQVKSTWTDQNFNLADLNAGTATVPVHDVSVMTLETPLPSTYTPISLAPSGDTTTLAGLSSTIVGYGETTAGNVNTVGTLYSATVPIQNDSTCASDTALAGFDSTTMLCAGAPAPTGGIDSCNGDSGGPLLITEGSATVEAGMTDWGAATACGTDYGVYELMSHYNSEITAAMNEPPIINLDFDGSGHSGLMAIDGSGNLWYYGGTGFLNDGFNGFAGALEIGSGWSGFKKVFRVTNWNNDNTESIMAIATNGNLYEYPTDGAGNFTNLNGNLIGTGWTKFTDIMVVNNWTGDGNADLLGRTSTGQLYLYEHNSSGWLNNGIGQLIGTGWNIFNTVLTPGTWTGDGHQALIGRTPSGGLYLYESDGQGGWLNNGVGIKIGTGWNIFNTFMSPGDWNGDGLVDLIGRNSSGALYLYETDGHGNWLNNGQGIQIGTGWGGFKAIF